MTKKGNGRKVEIKKIEKRGRLNVTFTRRRQGLFTKAKDLASSCGVDIAVIVFSPAGRLYSFSNSSVDSVVNQLVNQPCFPVSSQLPETDGRKGVGSRSSEIHWDVPIENMDFEELLCYKDLLQELMQKNL